MGRKPKEHLIGELVVAEGEVSRLRGFKEELTKQLVAAEDRNRELTRQVEQLRALVDELATSREHFQSRALAFELRLGAADKDARRYRWLRDIGDHTFKPLSGRSAIGAKAIDAAIDAALTAPPSSAPTDPGRADTKKERRIENELFAGDLYSGIKP